MDKVKPPQPEKVFAVNRPNIASREILLTPLVSVLQSVNLDSITAAAALGERGLLLFASTIHYNNHCSIQAILRCLDSYFTKFHCCTLPLRFNNFHSIRTLIVNNLSEFAVRCFEPSNCGGKMFVHPRKCLNFNLL